MKKIKNLFKYGDNHAITKDFQDNWNGEITHITEKVDGTNIRVTVRSGQVVRVEKRRNPSKIEKKKGIIEPWYVDASRYEKSDQHIFKSVDSHNWKLVPDGEHNCEAYGENIQGNPLNIEGNECYLFWLEPLVYNTLEKPKTFEEWEEYVMSRNSLLHQGYDPEGLVIHTTNGLYKIRRKDFIRYRKTNH